MRTVGWIGWQVLAFRLAAQSDCAPRAPLPEVYLDANARTGTLIWETRSAACPGSAGVRATESWVTLRVVKQEAGRLLVEYAVAPNSTNTVRRAQVITGDSQVSIQQSARDSVLAGLPNPVKLCEGDSHGFQTLTWNTAIAREVELRLGAPDGPLMGRFGPAGWFVTGRYVRDQTRFFLQAAGESLSTSALDTLAVFQARTVTEPCPAVSDIASITTLAGQAGPVAPGSILSLRGMLLSPVTASAAEGREELGGVRVLVNGQAATLLLVSPQQINLILPGSTPPGMATISVAGVSGDIAVARVAPGLFSASNRRGDVALATAVLVRPDGSQTAGPSYQCTREEGCVPAPISLGGPEDVVYLSFYGTGFRGRSSPAMARCLLDGEPAEVTYAGPHAMYPGVDQLNIRVPRTLAGRGEVDVQFTVDGRAAWPVRVRFE